jgi:plasmid stabilization system protein ParE
MAAAAVRFHPAAAQEAESTYDWYAARNPAAAHGFAKSYDRPSTPFLKALRLGRDMAPAHEDTCSRGTPSLWYTSFVAMTSRSSPWPMADGGLDTGGRDSETLSTHWCVHGIR